MFMINYLGVGGAEQQLLELVRGIDKTNFNPIVVSLYPGGDHEQEVRDIQGTELICLHRKGKYDFSILLKVLRLLQKRCVDVIQPYLTPAKFFELLPALVNRTPMKVMTQRGMIIDSGLDTNFYLRAETYLARFADWVIPNSNAIKDELVRRGVKPGRIRVIYNGINLRRLNSDPARVAEIRSRIGVPPDGKVVGITARLDPVKDHAMFLQAALIISRVMPSTRFAILGDGPLRADLEKQARELGLAERVAFLGMQQDVGSYVSAFDLACLTSMDREGCSNATLEAMALGKPVVVTDAGGNREVVEHGKTGLIVPVRNPQALADAVLNCLGRPDWAREMGQHAREAVFIRFSLERMVQDYQNLYEEGLSNMRAG
jgi:glycosyltransferase involved in cell wall biosynthesis